MQWPGLPHLQYQDKRRAGTKDSQPPPRGQLPRVRVQASPTEFGRNAHADWSESAPSCFIEVPTGSHAWSQQTTAAQILERTTQYRTALSHPSSLGICRLAGNQILSPFPPFVRLKGLSDAVSRQNVKFACLTQRPKPNFGNGFFRCASERRLQQHTGG